MNTEIKKHCDGLFGFLPSDRIEEFISVINWDMCMKELELKTVDIKAHNDRIGDGSYFKYNECVADIPELSMDLLHAILRKTVKTFYASMSFLRSYNIIFEYRGRVTGCYTGKGKEWFLLVKGTPGDIEYVYRLLSQLRIWETI